MCSALGGEAEEGDRSKQPATVRYFPPPLLQPHNTRDTGLCGEPCEESDVGGVMNEGCVKIGWSCRVGVDVGGRKMMGYLGLCLHSLHHNGADTNAYNAVRWATEAGLREGNVGLGHDVGHHLSFNHQGHPAPPFPTLQCVLSMIQQGIRCSELRRRCSG